jgi:hypothetical protein
MKIRHYAAIGVCAGSIVGFGGTAFAGEWAPGKGSTPIKTDHVANSICAFNGQDEPDAPDVDEDDGFWETTPAGGDVQSGGQVVAMFANTGPGAVAAAVEAGEFGGFGTDCRPGGDH